MNELYCTPETFINLKIDSLLIKISWTITFILIIFSIILKYQKRLLVSNKLFSVQVNVIFIVFLLFAFLIFHNLIGQSVYNKTFMILFYRVFDGTHKRYFNKY